MSIIFVPMTEDEGLDEGLDEGIDDGKEEGIDDGKADLIVFDIFVICYYTIQIKN
jgi:hypothetical protein